MPVNLIPWREKRRYQLRCLLYFSGFVIYGVIIMLAILIKDHQKLQLVHNKKRYHTLHTEILKDEIQFKSQLICLNMEHIKHALRAISNNNIDNKQIINNLIKTGSDIPKICRLTSLELTNKKTNVQGECKNIKAVNIFITSLSKHLHSELLKLSQSRNNMLIDFKIKSDRPVKST